MRFRLGANALAYSRCRPAIDGEFCCEQFRAHRQHWHRACTRARAPDCVHRCAAHGRDRAEPYAFLRVSAKRERTRACAVLRSDLIAFCRRCRQQKLVISTPSRRRRRRLRTRLGGDGGGDPWGSPLTWTCVRCARPMWLANATRPGVYRSLADIGGSGAGDGDGGIPCAYVLICTGTGHQYTPTYRHTPAHRRNVR